MDSPFLNRFAHAVCDSGFRVARFEFPYMQERRRTARRLPPDREPVLQAAWKAVVELLGGGQGVVLGGKSLGGRIASSIADDVQAQGLVCLGYPFHPPREPHRLRTHHLEDLKTPTLIVQGTRDPFGNRLEVDGYRLSDRISVVWIEDGDHSFKPRARSGRSEEQNLKQGVAAVVRFLYSLSER